MGHGYIFWGLYVCLTNKVENIFLRISIDHTSIINRINSKKRKKFPFKNMEKIDNKLKIYLDIDKFKGD